MSPLRAYNLGLMTEAHYLFDACRHLSSLYDELNDLHRAIEEAYNQRDEDGFYDIDRQAIDDMLIQVKNLYPRIDTMESYIREQQDK